MSGKHCEWKKTATLKLNSASVKNILFQVRENVQNGRHEGEVSFVQGHIDGVPIAKSTVTIQTVVLLEVRLNIGFNAGDTMAFYH